MDSLNLVGSQNTSHRISTQKVEESKGRAGNLDLFISKKKAAKLGSPKLLSKTRPLSCATISTKAKPNKLDNAVTLTKPIRLEKLLRKLPKLSKESADSKMKLSISKEKCQKQLTSDSGKTRKPLATKSQLISMLEGRLKQERLYYLELLAEKDNIIMTLEQQIKAKNGHKLDGSI